MAKEPKKLNLKSKIEKEEIIAPVVKKEPKKLNLKSEIETKEIKDITKEKMGMEKDKEILDEIKIEKEDKKDILKKAEIKNLIKFIEEDISKVKEIKELEARVISFDDNEIKEMENIKESDDISDLDEEIYFPTKEPILIPDDAMDDIPEEIETNSEDKVIISENIPESVDSVIPVAPTQPIPTQSIKPISLDESTLALLQTVALSNINNNQSVRKREYKDDDMIVEVANNLNDLEENDGEDLLDNMLIYTHDITSEELEESKFEDILIKILKDENVTDISFNGKDIYIQNNKKGRYLFARNYSNRKIEDFIKNTINSLNKEFTTQNPIVDCEIVDKYSENRDKVLRLNAVHDSISTSGSTMSIRITQPILRLTEDDDKFASKEVFKLLEAMIRGNLNMLISGRTGSGKTELQKFLIKNIRDVETIVLIEDTKDTNLKELYPEKNITSWVSNNQLENPIDFDALIKASLRNNPDWIIISETRGSEAYSMIKSGLSGHKIITTLHSDSAESNIDRLVHMCKEKYDLDQVLLGQMITSVFDVGVHIDYDITKEGVVRYICNIVEYKGYDELGVDINKIFEVSLQPVKDKNGKLIYKKVYKYGKISEELFKKLAKKKVLTPEISRFIKEEYYGKEI